MASFSAFRAVRLGNELGRRSWEVIESYLRRMRDLCREQGVAFAWVLFPLSFQLDTAGRFEDSDLPQQYAAEVAQHLGVPYFNMLPALLDRPAEPAIYFDHAHLTDYGNTLAAEALFKFVEPLLSTSDSPCNDISPRSAEQGPIRPNPQVHEEVE